MTAYQRAIITTRDGDHITVPQCPRCGAVVLTNQHPTHDAWHATHDPRKPTPRRPVQTLTPDFLAEVAAIYNAAIPTGTPRRALIDHYQLDRRSSTVDRWIARCRDLGLIAPWGET